MSSVILIGQDSQQTAPSDQKLNLHPIMISYRENPPVKIKIVGHTDSDGDGTKNLDLSNGDPYQ